MEAVSVKLQLLSLKTSETKDFQFNVAFKAFFKEIIKLFEYGSILLKGRMFLHLIC